MTTPTPAATVHSHLLCLGLGYTAGRLAVRVALRGWQVTGTSRSTEGCAAIERAGYASAPFGEDDRLDPKLDAALRAATHVLVSAAPGEDGCPVLRTLADALSTLPALQWIGYLSTVGVYGDRAGAWVDETDAPRPASERGRRRVEAETRWLALGERTAKRVEVFRLPGIYGPGRSAFDQLRAGTARRIVKPGQVFNRMHVDDIAGGLEAALGRDTGHRIYNLTDDEPGPPDVVVEHAAGLLGMAPPPAVAFAEANLSPMARSFYGESKRVSNRRMIEALGYAPAYPTFREGLAAILRAGG